MYAYEIIRHLKDNIYTNVHIYMWDWMCVRGSMCAFNHSRMCATVSFASKHLVILQLSMRVYLLARVFDRACVCTYVCKIFIGVQTHLYVWTECECDSAPLHAWVCVRVSVCIFVCRNFISVLSLMYKYVYALASKHACIWKTQVQLY